MTSTRQPRTMSSENSFEKQFLDVWNRFRNLDESDKKDVSRIKEICTDKKLYDVQPTLTTTGRFIEFECIEISCRGHRALLPLESPEQITGRCGDYHKNRSELWLSLGWFHPAYIQNKVMANIYAAIKGAPDNEKHDRLEMALNLTYTPNHIASMVSGRYREIPEIEQYLPMIQDAVKAHYLGLHAAAIVTLIPVVEGVLRSMCFHNRNLPDNSTKLDRVTGSELLKQSVAGAIKKATELLIYRHGTWIPELYEKHEFLERTDEFIWMLATFGEFGEKYLFKDSEKYAGFGELNRPGILHGHFTDFRHGSNFYKLISILDFLSFALSMNHSEISCLAPELTDEGKQLASLYMVFSLYLHNYVNADHSDAKTFFENAFEHSQKHSVGGGGED